MGIEEGSKPVRKNDRFYWEGTPSMAFYETWFEARYLESTKRYFSSKAQEWIQEDCYTYLNEANKAFAKEEVNNEFWLLASTRPKAMDLVVKELVTDQAEAIVDKEAGVVEFFRNRQLDKLNLLYRVFRRDENTFDSIIGKMSPYMEDIGMEIVQNEEHMKDPLVFT